MTARIVNLRTVRKQRARAERRQQATANAAKFGRSGAARARERAESEKARRQLDSHRRDRPGSGE